MASTNVPATPAASESELARGQRVALRRWDREEPGDWKPDTTRSYETVGVVLEGRAELRIGDEVRSLATGDTYLVPEGKAHSYRILQTFTSIEATSPPAE